MASYTQLGNAASDHVFDPCHQVVLAAGKAAVAAGQSGFVHDPYVLPACSNASFAVAIDAAKASVDALSRQVAAVHSSAISAELKTATLSALEKLDNEFGSWESCAQRGLGSAPYAASSVCSPEVDRVSTARGEVMKMAQKWPEPLTTERTTAVASSDLGAGLVTASELEEVPGLASMVQIDVSIADLHISDDVDPRAPCGARITEPKFDGEVAAFHSANGDANDRIAKLSTDAATRFMDAMRSDMRPGCPGFAQFDERGVWNHDTYLGSIQLPSTAGDALAQRERIAPPTSVSPTSVWVEILVRRRDVVSDFLYAGVSLSNDAVVRIANLMAVRLASVA